MFPVFTSPLGSRNETREAEFTENARRASAREPTFADPELSVFGVEVSPLLAAGVPEGLVRTRSAQDFGFWGEDTATWAPFSRSLASLLKGGSKAFEPCVFSDGDACVSGGSGALSGASSFAVAICDAVDWAFCGTGTFGVIGMTGTTGLVAVRVCVEEEVVREEEDGPAVDDGVGGCVESASEGTSDVAGVSWSEGVATVGLCELVRSSTVSLASSVCIARSGTCSSTCS